jgi:type IV pilus assembly protein PilC
LIAVAAVAIMALMGFVLPTFIDMFAEFGMELPMVTRLLFGYGKSVQKYWYLHFGVPTLIIVSFIRYIKGPGKSQWDHFLLRVKVFGSVVRKSQTAQFARTFGMLVQSGVPMLQALDILDRLSDNAVVRETVIEAKGSVRDGVGLARPLKQSQIFPPMLAHMVAIGEETGALDQMLHKTADFYDREVDQAIQSLTAMIEPAIILVIGVFAAFIVAAVMVPMFNMVNIDM